MQTLTYVSLHQNFKYGLKIIIVRYDCLNISHFQRKYQICIMALFIEEIIL